MSTLVASLRSSLGRKYVMGLTGLGLSGFVLTHMAGNLLILLGPAAYNTYGHRMVTNPLLPVAEIALAGLFLVHMACAISLNLENQAARPTPYRSGTTGAKAVSTASKTMVATGGLLGAFLIVHLLHFRLGVPPLGSVTMTEHSGERMRDLFGLAVVSFKNPLYLGGYALALWLLAIHLRHGLASAFQSLGLIGPRFRTPLAIVSAVYAAIVALGFLVPPLYLFAFGKA